ncbi:MAG TPA: TetR/AcrR family transcriptional regulator [Sphingobacterium sp.]|nr:TetR/AcrR family transcriptional regulator [Sphingobacterium sp.]
MSKKNADGKRIKILEGAKRRFAHYGMAKTTMAEIAKDLSFSKALLYYYFPDKNSLYGAVLEHIIEEFNEETNKSLANIEDTEEAIMELLNRRIEFIKKYYYIIEYAYGNRKDASPELGVILIRTFKLHRDGIKNVLQRGIDTGELKPVDVDEFSEIFLFSTMGLRMMVMKDMQTDFIPSKEEFDYIVEMQKKMAKVFIDGLRA